MNLMTFCVAHLLNFMEPDNYHLKTLVRDTALNGGSETVARAIARSRSAILDLSTWRAYDEIDPRHAGLERLAKETVGNGWWRLLRFRIGTEYLTPPEKMDSTLRARLTEFAERYEIPYIELASGSGHDAMVFARNRIPSAMIFVRNEHGSHNPNEKMSMSDFLQACELLYRALSE
jgi:acetylornithine deacetylase/succinyl-diaminopimelate desuccinylase-like protein